MAEIIQEEIVLASADQKFRWKLLITWDGRLAAVQLFQDQKDGPWKPRGTPKVLAWTDQGVTL